jgi:hypothetical protein
MTKFDSYSRKARYALSNVKTRWIALSLFLTILIFSCLYYVNYSDLTGTTKAEGMKAFWESTYFSVVTISSLGYGDIKPTGIVRFLSCIEVLIGFLFIGIIIGKVSSAKQEYWLRRIYNGTTIQNIRGFCISLENEVDKHKEMQAALKSVNNGQPVKLSDHNFSSDFNSINRNIKETIRVIDDFLYFEATVGEIFKDIPGGTINMAINSIESIVVQWRTMPKYQKEFVVNNNLFLTPKSIIRKIINITKTLKKYQKDNKSINVERIISLENEINLTMSYFER